jgi:hypothetical protein
MQGELAGASVVTPLERAIGVRYSVVCFLNRVRNGVTPVKPFYRARALAKRAITGRRADGLRR